MGKILLIFFTVVLIYLLVSQDSSQLVDELYPKPIIILEIMCKDDEMVKISEDSIVENCVDDDELNFNIILINNSSEPGPKGYELASGVLLVLKGAKFIQYRIESFQHIIGVSDSFEIIDPLNSSIIEIFSSEVYGYDVKRAYFTVRLDPEAEKIEIYFRGWIMDEDKKVFNPVDREEEPYIARFPKEDVVDNPPDTRWAGREFLRYKMFKVDVWRVR